MYVQFQNSGAEQILRTHALRTRRLKEWVIWMIPQKLRSIVKVDVTLCAQRP
jgi:hypothetical protein